MLWKIRTGSLGEIGWILMCILCCWTWSFWKPRCGICTFQYWWKRFWRRFVNNLKRMIRWNQLVIIGSVPQTLLEWKPTLNERGGFWKWQSRKYPLMIWCWSRAWIGARARGRTSPPCWGNHRGNRWSRNKCDYVRLRNRKKVMKYMQKMFMRLFQCKTQTTCTDVFCWRVCGFNKQGACLNHDVGEFVIWHERLRYQSSILPRNNGETHLHLTRACVEHKAELRKTNEALCRGKHNAALFYNPNQDVSKAMQGDFD